MGEGVAAVEITADQRAGVEAALRRRDLAPRVRERLEMVKGVALGYPLAAVARWSGRTARTVVRWVSAFAAGGVPALADAPRAGRPAKADARYVAALERAADTPPGGLGLPFDVWTSGRLGAYLAETTGVRIAPGWVRALLARQRFRCGRAKHTLGHLQDEATRTACEQTLQAVGENSRGKTSTAGAEPGLGDSWAPLLPPARAAPGDAGSAAAGKKVAAAAGAYELHFEDETHLETNPYLSRVWHRIGVQPTVPAAGTNRRLTCFGSVEALGRGRVEVLCAAQDSAAFLGYLEALDARFAATGREIFLVLDNGPCHTSKASRAALAARAARLHVIWLAPYCPNLNPKEREWRYLKRDVRSHLARTLRAFADEILAGLDRLGGARRDIVDRVPQWFLDGHRRPPTGRRPGRPKGSKDSHPRVVRRTKLAAAT